MEFTLCSDPDSHGLARGLKGKVPAPAGCIMPGQGLPAVPGISGYGQWHR